MWIDDSVLAFARRHDTTPTLSVYVAGGLSTPTMRRAARVVLQQQVDDVSTRHADEPDVLRTMERCTQQMLEALPSDEELHRLGTWYCFVPAEGEMLTGSVPDPLDSSVRWDSGPAVAPLLQLGAPSPAFLLLIDKEHARLSRVERTGFVTLLEESIEPVVGVSEHLGSQPRQGFHHGTHGATLTEEVQRRRAAARDRFQASVRRAVETRLGAGGALLVGGATEEAERFRDSVSDSLTRRAAVAPGLHFDTHATAAHALVRARLRALSDNEMRTWFTSLREQRRSAGRSAVGPQEVDDALDLRNVDVLVLTQRFLRHHTRGAHRLVLLALKEGATVRVATLAAATELDAHAMGVAATLRFPIARSPDTLSGEHRLSSSADATRLG